MENPTKGRKRREDGDRPERDRFANDRYTPKLLGKSYFQRKKGCPFSGPKAPKIDYKDVRLLQRYVSEYGKILPRHLSGVCAGKQRELATAIKRARMLALMPFAGKLDFGRPPRTAATMAQRPGGRPGMNRSSTPAATPETAAE
ncbi:MAG: 30S ribosomal protein S18 [Alphaproteobacteria bacterium CG_4_10_14_0_8_um_filter_53_9]|nr:MAG: 30S ribosomal protein S18 [Alphaproteobacteria bacterium CG_4_10_14_0_8_um_filter_53_9]